MPNHHPHILALRCQATTQNESLPSLPSNLGRQPRTRVYQYRCIFKDYNEQCQTRGRGPPGNVTKFLCEEHTVKEEQEDEKDEDYKDEEDGEDEEREHEEDEEYDDGEDEKDEEIDDGGTEGEILKGEDETYNATKLLRSGHRI